jgi:hypothetical protein
MVKWYILLYLLGVLHTTYLRVEGQCSSGSKKMRRVMASSEYVEAKCGPHREYR